MIIEIKNTCSDFNSYRAARVKSLFNANRGFEFVHTATLDLPKSWSIGVIVGQSGSGKTSIGKKIFGEDKIIDLFSGWEKNEPIIDSISPKADFNDITSALSSVGLGDVPAWLRPFHVLSNGQKFRAGLARLILNRPEQVVVDEFTSVVDRQIAKIGAQAFSKSWKRGKGQCVLLSCHYDILDWLEPDWVYDTNTGAFSNDCLRRPKFDVEIFKVNQRYWKFFKPHYYLDLPMPPAAEYFIGTVKGELVCHLAVCPFFTGNAYRATRLVVMPEWQGAGVGLKFLEWVCQYHLEGNGRCGRKLGTVFHTSHPNLVQALRRGKRWIQKSALLFGGNKALSAKSILKANRSNQKKVGNGAGYGGHFRAVQGFKYIGEPC